MKKLISTIIISIIFLLPCTQIFANDIGKITLNSNDSVKAGEEIIVKICGTELGEGINGLQGKITYDTNVLEYVGKKAEKENWSITAYNEETGIFLAEVINVLEAEVFEQNEEVPIISFTFKVKEDTTANNTQITLSDLVVSPNDVQIESNSVNKEITITRDIDTNVPTPETPGQTPSGTPDEIPDETPDETPSETPNEIPNEQEDTTIAPDKIPHAGLGKEIIFVLASIMVIMFSSYLGYNKYREI